MKVAMADFTTDDFSEADMVTSFSNPNYALGLKDHCIMAEGGSSHHDSNGNLSLNDDITCMQMSVDDSGDSAISSPVTDSDLASPSADDVIQTRPSGGGTLGRHDEVCTRMQRAVQLHLLEEMKLNNSDVVDGTSDQNRTNHSAEGQSFPSDPLPKGTDAEDENSKTESDSSELPPGWQKHEDKEGAYYWHIKSGTIQRDVPVSSPSDSQQKKDVTKAGDAAEGSAAALPSDAAQEASSAPSADGDETASREYEVLTSDVPGNYPIRFAVRSLGWVPIAEDQLTQENSSRAVNQCIVSLSSGLRDINDVVGKWGDGKYLYMDLDQENLSLIDPHDLTVLNVQPIRSIRVWGVGRDNGRDFAYVARDRATRRHMCHVFRCELPARHIANTLCDICKKLIAQRAAAAQLNGGGANQRSRPTDLPNLHRAGGAGLTDGTIKFENLLKNASFPTPMDEPRKVMTCHFLGTIPVSMATGIEVLNGAIETLYNRVPAENWTCVNVTVAPSTITIADHKAPDNIIAECRVRFLSFLGISVTNVKLCAYIMHTAQDQFVAYVFHCEPSAGALSKTVEAACKLRYQKCLDKALSVSEGLSSPPNQSGSCSATKDFDSLEPVEQPELNETGFKARLMTKAFTVKDSTLTKMAELKVSAQIRAVALKDGAVSTAATLKESAQNRATVLRDTAWNSGIALRDNISSKAAAVKDTATNSTAGLRQNVSSKTAIVRAGLSTRFELLRKTAGSYFSSESSNEEAL